MVEVSDSKEETSEEFEEDGSSSSSIAEGIEKPSEDEVEQNIITILSGIDPISKLNFIINILLLQMMSLLRQPMHPLLLTLRVSTIHFSCR
jgi:hypothetical protein